MKKLIVIMAATALSITSVSAQSLDEGIKMYQYEKYQSAEKIFQPLAANNPMANYYYGLSQLGLEDTSGARATFSKYPDDPANMAGMARVAFAEGNSTLGLQIATTVANKAKRKEWEPLKYAADAITYSDQGSYQQAVDWYKTALQHTDAVEVHIALGDAYQKISGGGGDAMNNYESATTKDPKNSLAYSRIGSLWYAAKNYSLALDNYNKAKEADSTNPLPYRDLANAYELTGKYDLALQNIQKYLELSDKSVKDEMQYMDILYLSKHYNKAINAAEELIHSGVIKARFYGILAYSQLQIKDSTDALKNVRLYFSQQDPKKIYPMDYLNYGKILMMNSQYDSASYYFNQAIAKDTSKDKSDIYRQVAEGFKEAKDWTMSATWYTKLVNEYPNTQPLDYFWRGVMYFYAKDYDNAGKAFEDMENKFPDQPSAIYWRARVAAAVDNQAKDGTAVPFFTKWLEKVGPDYEKKNDLKLAYEYLALYYFNKEDKASMEPYLDKITAIDPNDQLVSQIRDYEKKVAEAKKAAAKKAKK